MPVGGTKLPYTHPRSLRSILRNSPLPPLSTKSPDSPRRQSLRLQEKAARRVAYNSPLTQEITTWRYTRSHIDLLAEDATPISPSVASDDDGDNLLDQAMADAASCDTTRDGGQTPGPFEEMRRRMANMHASTPMTLSPTGGGGIRKRGGKRREKKRRWVWTIGQDEEAEEAAVDSTTPATAIFEPASSTTPTKKDTPVSVPVLGMPAPRPRTRNQQAQLAKAVAAAAAAAAAAATTNQVPLLGLPTPPTRPAAAASQPPAPPQPHQEIEQDRHARELTPIPSSLLPTRHSTPDSCSGSVRHLSPEPQTATMPTALSMSMFRHMGGMGMRMGSMGMRMDMMMGMDVDAGVDAEPPTPSVESNCSRDSVFETSRVGGGGRGVGGDVEMSDASSFTSDDGEKDGVVGKEEEVVVGGKYTGGGYGGEEGDVEMDEGTPTMTARPVEGRGRGWVPWGNNGS